jgi:hypothetical protein
MNVLLSGGGLKGAYQYGFFKKLYDVEPNFKINKVFSVSVGSLNAIPILVKKMDLLDKHWKHEELMPFDTIVNDWPTVNSKLSYYRNIQRIRAFINNGSIFHSLDVKICFDLLNSLTKEELQVIKNKLIIISYDKSNNKIVFGRCKNIPNTVESIKNSSLFPGLFSMDSDIIDGVNIDLNTFVFKKKDRPLLCLDLQGHVKRCTNYPSNVYVYSPKITANATLNLLTCILASREMLDDLIDEGMEDANDFLNKIS